MISERVAAEVAEVVDQSEDKKILYFDISDTPVGRIMNFIRHSIINVDKNPVAIQIKRGDQVINYGLKDLKSLKKLFSEDEIKRKLFFHNLRTILEDGGEKVMIIKTPQSKAA